MKVEYVLNHANGKNIAVCNTIERAKRKAGLAGLGVEWRQAGQRWWGFVNGQAKFCIHTHRTEEDQC